MKRSLASFALAAAFAIPAPAVTLQEALPTGEEKPVVSDFRRAGKPADGTVSDDTQVLVPALRGCLIVRDTVRGLALQKQHRTGVQTDGFSDNETAAATAAAAPQIGQAVSLRSLSTLSDAIESALQRRGGNMVRASFPDQEITGGIIVVLVSNAKAGPVTVHGSPKFGGKFIRDGFRTRPGDELSRDVVTADLDWLNENPLRRARATFTPGSGADDLDLALHIQADKPWRMYGGSDNNLNDRLGDERWFLGFQHGNLWGLDHRVTVQATAGFDYDALHAASLTYEAPLPWRHLLEISVSTTETSSSRPSSTGGLIDQNGSFQRYAANYRIPLTTWRGWKQEVRAGFSVRDHSYELGTDTTDVQFFQLETGWQASRLDNRGGTAVRAVLHWSPGWFASDDDVFQSLGADGADSLLAVVELERSLTLGKAGILTGKLDAQWSDSALLAADQFAAAIAGRIRGFDEVTGFGDTGAALILEYLSPPLHLPHAGSLRGLTFLDSAAVHDRSADSGSTFVSTGLGFRWQWHDHTASCDLGIPLHAPDGVDDDPRLRFAFITRW